MIQALADRIAGYVVKNDGTANHEILAYGFGLILYAIFTYAVVFASALLFGVIREMLVVLPVFWIMRYTVGGCHANSRLVCFITSTSSFYLCIFLAHTLVFRGPAIAVLLIVNLLVLIRYAPGDTQEQPMVKRRWLRKLLGVVFLLCFFALSVFNRGMRVEANILLLVPTLVSVLLHPYAYRIYRCKQSSFAACGQ